MAQRPATGYAYLDAVLDQPGPRPAVLAMAHRGGAGHPEIPGTENTLHAFTHAVALGYRYLETDVHATSDGVLVVSHDDALERTTGHPGRITRMRAGDLETLRIGGLHGVPTMASLLEEFPDARFNVDLKSPGAVGPLAALVEDTGSHDRICVGSFWQPSLDAFRRATGGRVATSASPAEVGIYLTAPLPVLARLLTRGRVACLQVPHHRGPFPLVTGRFVRRVHAAGAHVHVWTVDEPAEIHQLCDLGVDGLITDRTDVTKAVLEARGQWLG